MKIPFALLFLICGLTLWAEPPPSPLVLEKTIPLDDVRGRIDHLAADVSGHRLFMAALGNNTVEVLDLKTGKRIQTLSGFAEPQGIVYAAEFNRLFVANGADGTCRILDGRTFAQITSLDIGDDADNVRYDETAKKVYVGYGTGALAVLDANSGAKVAAIPLAGHPESFRMETGSPNLYVNVPDASQIAVVDRSKGTVTATWPLKTVSGNFPMFLDETHHRMFVGCRSPAALLVYDYPSGRLVANVAIGHDTDDLFYDGLRKLIYVSCGGGSIEVIKQIDPDNYEKVDTVLTKPGARTSLFIPELNLLCVAVPRRGNQEAEVLVYKTR